MSDSFLARVGTAVPTRRARPPSAPEPLPDPSGERTRNDNGRRWSANDRTFWSVTATYDELPPGSYKPQMVQNIGLTLTSQHIEVDNLINLPDDATASILEEFQTFWQLRPEFRRRGFLCKRGFLLWGPPGSGKTSCLRLMIRRLADELNGVAIYIDHPGVAGAVLQMLRGIEPIRPLICILEDIDALIEEHSEQEFLSLLDGEAQVDNITFVATTNYPERLDPRFVDRPSRFDTIKYVGMPSAAARRMYLSLKEPDLSPADLDEWVKLSDGFSVAHLKEMIIGVRCFRQPLRAVVNRLDEMHSSRPKSSDAPDAPTRFPTLSQRDKKQVVQEKP